MKRNIKIKIYSPFPEETCCIWENANGAAFIFSGDPPRIVESADTLPVTGAVNGRVWASAGVFDVARSCVSGQGVEW